MRMSRRNLNFYVAVAISWNRHNSICVLLGAIPFSEGTEYRYHSVHSAIDS